MGELIWNIFGCIGVITIISCIVIGSLISNAPQNNEYDEN